VQCPETRELAAAIMSEVDAVAQKLGIEMGVSIEQRLQGAEKVGHHKTSMLQDIEARKPTELKPFLRFEQRGNRARNSVWCAYRNT
jgi:2-dehydropantoate 2-reductase